MNKLIFTDATTNEEVFVIDVVKTDEGFFECDTSLPIYQNFEFEIDCALYGLNEGGAAADSVEDEECNPYVFWKLI